MCRVRAKILVARKMGREQKRERNRIFARTRHIALRSHGNACYAGYFQHQIVIFEHLQSHTSQYLLQKGKVRTPTTKATTVENNCFHTFCPSQPVCNVDKKRSSGKCILPFSSINVVTDKILSRVQNENVEPQKGRG